ncbi:hypothetical protein [Dysosmobacter sp.]|uniref:hypothetical protein n=1 Tax=Dysosmobacter sp. TaxID=2591382 RepID=UPI002A8D038D|nr:hypothetical protein [Dysosmobacter sp.]MDY3282021.1 hypothetical protein [Dysosmobacter sp.]
MKARRGFSPPPVGGTTLLAVFAVLCLTVFAVLSLSAVRADDRLSRKSADAVAACYRAEAEAEAVLARLRSGEVPAGVTAENGIYRYQVPVSDTRALRVEVRVQGREYSVLRWETVSADDAVYDSSLAVWDGN